MGPGIFSDDTAADVRDEYVEMLEDGIDDSEAQQRLLRGYSGLDDEQHIVWLALAATQVRLGRLTDDVKERALAVIDSGEGLEAWSEAGPKALAGRNAVLAKLRTDLTGAQPARKATRRPWRHVTDLQAGDILALPVGAADHIVLLRVARIEDDRVGVAPIIERLDWSGSVLPGTAALRELQARVSVAPGSLGGSPRPETYGVARHRRKDPDHGDEGFRVVAHVEPLDVDAHVQAWTLTHWAQFADILRRENGAR
jgi:hypothetical protein